MASNGLMTSEASLPSRLNAGIFYYVTGNCNGQEHVRNICFAHQNALHSFSNIVHVHVLLIPLITLGVWSMANVLWPPPESYSLSLFPLYLFRLSGKGHYSRAVDRRPIILFIPIPDDFVLKTASPLITHASGSQSISSVLIYSINRTITSLIFTYRDIPARSKVT